MESFREQRCRTCRAIFYVCRRCDRGQAYCSDACGVVSRARQVRDAKQRYRQHELVLADERDRQRERRRRVRDQGSEKVAPRGSVPADAMSPPMDGGDRAGGDDAESDGLVSGLRVAGGNLRCAFCDALAWFVRVGPLRRWRARRRVRGP
jgi:hypothetical protein